LTGKDEREQNLVPFELDQELSIIVKNNGLPQRIADKIGQKIKEHNIQLTRNQLYQLVEKIQNVLQSSGLPVSPLRKSDETAAYQSADMKKLLDSIDQLKDRIRVIENGNFKGLKGPSHRLVKTKDIKVTDKVDLSYQEEIEPLLDIANDPESIVVLMKWLQYLVDKIGKEKLPELLGYYVDIDWISDDVRLDMIKYSKGITDNSKKDTTHQPNLSTKDHIQSLLFIQKLKGIELDDRFIFRIDRQMEKMARSIEEYQFK